MSGRSFSGQSWFGRSLPALDPQVDLYPLLVLLNDAVILAQRVALPAVGEQDALQVGMSFEADAEHVEDFTLQPVGRWPDGNGAGYRLRLGIRGFDPNTFIERERIQNPNQFELFLPV